MEKNKAYDFPELFRDFAMMPKFQDDMEALCEIAEQEDWDSEAWQAFDESERIESVRQYHRQNRIRLADESLHATTHVIVENQVALGDTFAAPAVLLRLMAEGLDRHEAIYAIGSVLVLFSPLRSVAISLALIQVM